MKHSVYRGLTCWFACLVMAAVGAAILGILLWLMLGWSAWLAVLIGLVVMLALWAFLVRHFCHGQMDAAKDPTVDVTISAPAAAASLGVAVATDTVANKKADVASVTDTQEATANVAEPEPAPEPEPEPAAVPEPEPEQDPDLASAPGTEPAQAAAESAANAIPDYDGDGLREGTEEGSRPAALDGPRDEGADDLKRIKGIGPKLENLCNSLGFFHFDQIAAWTGDEVAWVDANLEGFRGRVTRDEWVAQAKLLAAGEETEFSKRVDKGDVY